MDIKTFHRIRPTISKSVNTDRRNAEPSIFSIINEYYISNGLPPERSGKLTREYLAVWIKDYNKSKRDHRPRQIKQGLKNG